MVGLSDEELASVSIPFISGQCEITLAEFVYELL